MKISIVPEIINKDQIKITDNNFVPVRLCEKSISKFNSVFQEPYLIINSFDSTKYKEVEIKRIQLPQIEKLGYRLVSISINTASRKNMQSYKGQRTAYMIKKKTDPLEGSIEMFRVPTDHCLEIDIINKRIRVRGRNSYPYIRAENSSKWIEVEL